MTPQWETPSPGGIPLPVKPEARLFKESLIRTSRLRNNCSRHHEGAAQRICCQTRLRRVCDVRVPRPKPRPDSPSNPDNQHHSQTAWLCSPEPWVESSTPSPGRTRRTCTDCRRRECSRSISSYRLKVPPQAADRRVSNRESVLCSLRTKP